MHRDVAVGEYEILRELGSGANGTVYAARHRVLRRRAAIKVLHAATPDAVDRFAREVRSMNVIKHPGIVDIYEYGQLPDGRPYYVMEFLEGVTLEALLGEREKLTQREAFELLEPICGALMAAHDAGVVHRDIKPSNIFVAKTGAKLLDFGIAKLIYPQPWEPELTRIDECVGTPTVMAPEQIFNISVDPRTDIYAMGVVLYRALTGQYPFTGNDFEIASRHLRTVPPAPSSITPLSPELDALVLRCLAKSPAARYPSMDAFRVAFRNAVTTFAESEYPRVSELSRAMPPATTSAVLRAKPPTPVRARVRWPSPLVLILLVLLFGLGGAAIAQWNPY